MLRLGRACREGEGLGGRFPRAGPLGQKGRELEAEDIGEGYLRLRNGGL